MTYGTGWEVMPRLKALVVEEERSLEGRHPERVWDLTCVSFKVSEVRRWATGRLIEQRNYRSFSPDLEEQGWHKVGAWEIFTE